MKDAVREAIKELLIPELNEIKAGMHRLGGREKVIEDLTERVGRLESKAVA